jgi:glycogen(starch) synthase
MHVVFLTPRFYPYPGGYENYILALARRLVATRQTVSVLTTNAFDLEFFWLKERRSLPVGVDLFEGIKIRRLAICHAKWRRRASRLLGLLPSWQLRSQFRRPGFRVIGLREALRDEQPDVIHIGPLPYMNLMYCGVREATERGARLLCTPCTHFGEAGNDSVSRHYTQPYQIELLKHCDTILTLTAMERERLIELGVPPERVFPTGAGIDVDINTGGNEIGCRARHGINGPVVLHLGTKAPDKGSIAVLEAMHTLWAEGICANLVMAGSSVREFEEYAAARPHERFLNLGPVSDAEKRDLLAVATVVVQPSRVESFGMVYLEAWANRKALIAADTPVSRELVQSGEDGVLVPFGNSTELARAIGELLADGAERERIGANGWDKLRHNFEWTSASDRILKHFHTGRTTHAGAEVPK